uniref:Glycerate kinase n=1 Tax=Bracon brevicornis TaxID=1563983 RepID=A0A6V7HTN0_9HYME
MKLFQALIRYSCVRELRTIAKMAGDRNLTSMRSELKEIFAAGLNSVKPHVLIKEKVRVQGDELIIDGFGYEMTPKVHLVGCGKAVLGMALEMEKLLGNRLMRGIVSLPRGSAALDTANFGKYEISKARGVLSYHENCENNVADVATLEVTREIISLVQNLDERDTLIVLISGGSSALLSQPHPSLTLAEKNAFWKNLQNRGADIKEVNKVRQKLSMVKGGKFAKLAFPARVIGLVLSDVIGDPIDLIGSAPTHFSDTEPEEIREILGKYGFKENEVDRRIWSLLCEQNGGRWDLQDGGSRARSQWNRTDFDRYVTNIIIGNNLCAINAAKEQALNGGLKVVVLRNDIEGLVRNVSRMYINLAKSVCLLWEKKMARGDFVNEVKSVVGKFEDLDAIVDDVERGTEGILMIGGGEPAVIVKGTGKGGRNQELALQFSEDWAREVGREGTLGKFEVLFLSAGTDGQDGPTDATGAFGYSEIAQREPKFVDFLRNNDAYHFYERFNNGSDLLKTGFTGTNVMDLHFVYLRRRG